MIKDEAQYIADCLKESTPRDPVNPRCLRCAGDTLATAAGLLQDPENVDAEAVQSALALISTALVALFARDDAPMPVRPGNTPEQAAARADTAAHTALTCTRQASALLKPDPAVPVWRFVAAARLCAIASQSLTSVYSRGEEHNG